MGWLVRTFLDILPRSIREGIAKAYSEDGLIFAVGIGGGAVVARPEEWLDRGGEAWKEIGHDGAKVPTNEPWERRR